MLPFDINQVSLRCAYSNTYLLDKTKRLTYHELSLFVPKYLLITFFAVCLDQFYCSFYAKNIQFKLSCNKYGDRTGCIRWVCNSTNILQRRLPFQIQANTLNFYITNIQCSHFLFNKTYLISLDA